VTHRRTQFVVRLLVALAAFTLVARHAIGEGVDAVRADNPYQALWLAIPAAAVVSVVRHEFVQRRVHVHDSDLDLLVAMGVSLAIFGVLTEFSSRLGWAGSSLRPDFALAPLILFTIVSPLFGLRTAMEQVPAFHLVGAAWPFPYIVESSFVPYGALFWVILATLASSTAAALVRWPARFSLPVSVVGNLVAVGVCARVDAGWTAIPASLVVVLVLRRALRRPWVWQDGLRPDPTRPSGWPRKRFGVPFVLAVGLLASTVPSSGLDNTAVAAAPALPLDSCVTPRGWTVLQHTTVGGGPDRSAGDWSVSRCEYTAVVTGTRQHVAVDVSEPVSWVELGSFPTPTVLVGGGVLDPLTSHLTIGGSEATEYVWHQSNIGGALVVLSWHHEVSPRQWQRIEVMVASTDPPVGLPRVESRPLKSLMERVGVVLRTQVTEASQFEVSVPEGIVTELVARQYVAASRR
jgi:hypothetical protein